MTNAAFNPSAGKELLDTLWSFSGFTYLSDLRFRWEYGTNVDRDALSEAVLKCVGMAFSLKEWEYAVHYITGEYSLIFKATNEAAAYLCAK